MAVGRAPESGPALCSQPTMCRPENLPAITALKRMMAAIAAWLVAVIGEAVAAGDDLSTEDTDRRMG